MFPRLPLVLLVLALTLAAPVLAACGEDEPGAGAGGPAAPAATGNGIDRAFVADMIPHHESAVEMAQLAADRAESEFVRELAAEIIEAQNAEIDTMRSVDAQLEDVEAGDLGIADHLKGMGADTAMLETAEPFDRAFIDMMVPHHRGAIEMARVELEQGENPQLKRLAQAIIEAQEREIAEMSEHREETYGAPVPESDAHGAVAPPVSAPLL